MAAPLTPDLLPSLYSPQALMVYLRRLSSPHLHTLSLSMQRLERTHPAHWQAIEQARRDRMRLFSQGGGHGGWRE